MNVRRRRARERLLTAFAASLALAAASPAVAQHRETAPARAPGVPVEPPRVIAEERPRYPDGATGAASVLLDVVVEDSGAVSDVRIVEGDEPFASAAIEAAQRTRFAPARRGERAVRARIRIATTFTPPPPPRKKLDLPPLESGTGAPEAVEEVRVSGQRDEPKTPTEHRLGRAEMRVVPGAFGDPFRAIDILPGVVPIISGLPFFYVRGAPPSAVGYYIDEVRVPYLFHFGLGPGVIQPALVDEVALHPAAFPGRYGRYAGGIVAGTTRDPATELYGEGQIRIFDAGAYVEAPFAGGRGSAGIGGRYSYTAGLISLVAPDTTIDYRDYNARVSYQLSDRWRATAFALGSFDFLSGKEGVGGEEVEKVFFASEFHRLDTRFDRRGADGSISRVGVTFGVDRTRLEGARFAQSFMTAVRGRHRQPITKSFDVEVGADATIDHYTGDIPNPYAVSERQYDVARELFAPRTDSATGVWTSASWRPEAGWDLTATMRGDVFTSAGKVAFGPSPRVSMRVPLVNRVAFLGALGVAPQTPAFAIPVPAIGFRGLPGGLGFAYQKSAGVEVGLPLKFTLRTVGFHHSYFNLRDFAASPENVDFDKVPPPSSPSQALGLEVFLSRKLSERYAAFTSATFSRAQLGSSALAPARVSPFDRTFVVQVGGVADLGRGWRASSRFLTYGGWPTDDPRAVATPAPASRGGRLPAFFRVDLRIEKRWTLRAHRWISLVLEGLNVTGSQEVVARRCGDTGCADEKLPPLIIPSLGVEGAL